MYVHVHVYIHTHDHLHTHEHLLNARHSHDVCSSQSWTRNAVHDCDEHGANIHMHVNVNMYVHM